MIKRAAPLCFLLFILTACLSERSLTAPAADRGEWKNAYQGEEVFLVTQGTVAVEAVNMLIREIPGARWTARFDYDSDISGNYIVLDFTDEKSGTPLEPVINEMFSGSPLSGTLQVNSSRIRLGYYSFPSYGGWTPDLAGFLQAYARLIEESAIEKTRGAWYTDPQTAYLKDISDKRTGETYLAAVNYTTGEEKPLVSYELSGGRDNGTIPWTIRLKDLSGGQIEWVSGLISAHARPGENLTGFYGAMDEGDFSFSGSFERDDGAVTLSLAQADLEFGDDLMLTWVRGRGLRKAYPDNGAPARITGEEKGYLVSGFDFSGRPFPLFLLEVDYRTNRVRIRTYMRMRNLELPLIFNETVSSSGVGKMFYFEGLRSDFTQELTLPVGRVQSLRIGPVEGDGGFADLYDGRFYSLTERPEADIVPGENSLIIYSNHLPFGDLTFAPRLFSFYPELDVLDIDWDLTLPEEGGASEYYLRVETSPMEPGTTYQVTIQAHPSLFEEGYVWEFTAP